MTTIEKACLGKTANSVCRRSVATRFEESIPVIIVSSTDRLADKKKKDKSPLCIGYPILYRNGAGQTREQGLLNAKIILSKSTFFGESQWRIETGFTYNKLQHLERKPHQP